MLWYNIQVHRSLNLKLLRENFIILVPRWLFYLNCLMYEGRGRHVGVFGASDAQAYLFLIIRKIDLR